MDVARNAGTGETPEIRAKIESLGSTQRVQRLHTTFQRQKALRLLFHTQPRNIRGVTVRNDHQMAAIVRKSVQNDVTVLSPPGNEILPVVVGFRDSAQQAAARFLAAFERFDVR